MKRNVSIAILLLVVLVACSKQIDTSVKPGNEGYMIGNGSVGVVLTHGLAATPCEINELAHYLAQRNITVDVVRLAGHGTSVEDLNTKTWQDWYSGYHDGYRSLKSKQKVFAVGMSLGGMLALKLAEDENVSGVIALAPSLELYDGRTHYAWLIKYVLHYVNRDLRPECSDHAYGKFPVSSIAENIKLSAVVRSDLHKITSPLFLMQYRNDTRVIPESSQEVYDEVSGGKELHWLNGTGHVMLLDQGKERYFEQIYGFIKAHS